MLGFPAKEKFRDKCKISQTFREILHFFVKMNLAKGSANDVEFREKNCENFAKKLQ